MDDVISDIVDVINKARELSAICREYHNTVKSLESMVTEQRNLVEYSVYLEFTADVPEEIFDSAVEMMAFRRFIRLIEILINGPGSMTKAKVGVKSAEISLERIGKDDRRVWINLRTPNMCDLARAAVIEKYGGVISRIIQESEKKSKEVAKEYRKVADIATVIDAMLR
jgi:type III secretion system FlhB-like substrate exporter